VGRDPFDVSWPLEPDETIASFYDGVEDETVELIAHERMEAEPQDAEDLAVRPSPRRSTWTDAEDHLETMSPPHAAGFGLPERVALDARKPVRSSRRENPRQVVRRRLASGCVSSCLALLLLALVGVSVFYLRSNVEQPGSGQANSVELQPTPVTPLAQVQSSRPTPTPTATPGRGGNSAYHGPPDPQATPTPKYGPAATATPSFAPTMVPTIGPTQVPTSPVGPPTPSATSMPPTVTLIPRPTTTTVASAGSLTFTDQSQQFSGPATLTGCPSGCSFPTESVNGSTQEGAWQSATGYSPQTQLSGSVSIFYECTAGVTCSGKPIYFVGAVSGGGYTCPVNRRMPAGTSFTIGCTLYVSSPSSLPAYTIAGRLDNIGGDSTLYLQWYNQNAFYGNGYTYVTQADCNNALTAAANDGWTWISATWNSASNGKIVARTSSNSENGWTCWPQVGAQANGTTGTLDAYISNGLVYAPSDAINAAHTALAAAQPAGWNWIYTSPACYPTTAWVSGNSVGANCEDSALAVYPWSSGDKAGLAQSVAGQSISAAESICNGYAHVAGNCVASSNSGNTMPPPADWQAISVSPRNPPNPWGSAVVSPSPTGIGIAFQSPLPPLSLALLSASCLGVLWRRHRRVRKGGA
jgi:hypothetical protein